jgi:pyruvate,water dikinase
MRYVLRFTETSASDPSSSGGKGASLARLTQAGFPVPAGFVISPLAYIEATASIAALAGRAPKHPHDHAAIERASAGIIAALHDIALPALLVAEIASSCEDIGGDGRWAVRSSGTAEDLAGAAFAGQHDTFLNCVGIDDVLHRVLDCWCSLWSPRAIAYRARFNFDHRDVAMAVVVQRMVYADAAGVAFTIDPVGGSFGAVVIDANFGLGESVVSGAVDVDHLVVDKRSWAVTAKRIGAKATRTVATASGTEEVHAEDAADTLSLGDEQAAAIAKLAVRVEEHQGWPQDVEWAIANGRVALLQARPITTIPPRWTRDESAERFPNVIAPLTWDFVEEGFHRSLNHSFALMGLPAYEGKWFACFGHYVYGNQNAVELYARRSPVPALPLPELVRHLPAIIQRFRWIAELPPRWHAELPRFLAEIDAFLVEPIERYDLAALWDYIERVKAAGTRYFLPNIAISIGHGVLHRGLRALVGASAAQPEEAETLCARLVSCETMTTRVNEELRDLATLAHADNVFRDDVRDSRALWIASGEGDETPFWIAVRRFVTTHGHRETDFDAYHPTWSEAPWVVLDHLRTLAKAPERAQEIGHSLAAQQTLVAATIQALPTELRELGARVIALAREYTALDDLEHYHTTRLSLPLRRGVREIGRRLRSLGVVRDEMDAFFASASSLAAAVADARKMPVLRSEIAAGKATYLVARDASPAWSLEESSSSDAMITGDTHQLAGIPGSPGAAEGIVHIVRGTEDFAGFPEGAVLVARTTNPAWTPLFYTAAAVVTESGGPLSHGAVTAREMRIPAVMAVRDAMSKLRNGDRVRVDGASGRVEVLAAA